MSNTSTAQIKKTLNKAEFELYQSTTDRNIKDVTSYRLKLKQTRLKKLIDKYSTKKMASKRLLKSKGLDSGAESIRKAKLNLLKVALKNVDTAIKKVAKPLKPKTTKKAVKKKAAVKKVKPKKTVAKGTKSPKALVKRKKMVKSGVIRKQAHSKSRARRSQGKKDSR
jgi:hypothetical protein